MTIAQGTLNLKGFDCNTRVTAEHARAFFAHGYRYAIRYVRRETKHDYDLTVDEIHDLFRAGLALMPVQHVESEKTWLPSPEKGAKNGDVAAHECAAAGIEKGTTVWCDLEGVSSYAAAATTINYCNRWFDAVAAGGWQPGLYVGNRCGLTGKQLFRELRFTRYWSAFNLNADEHPTIRDVCMKQHAAKRADIPRGVPFEIDTDIIMPDKLGGLPTLMVPPEWGPAYLTGAKP